MRVAVVHHVDYNYDSKVDLVCQDWDRAIGYIAHEYYDAYGEEMKKYEIDRMRRELETKGHTEKDVGDDPFVIDIREIEFII